MIWKRTEIEDSQLGPSWTPPDLVLAGLPRSSQRENIPRPAQFLGAFMNLKNDIYLFKVIFSERVLLRSDPHLR